MSWCGAIPTTESAVTATVDVGDIAPYMSRRWAVGCVIPGSCSPPLGGPPGRNGWQSSLRLVSGCKRDKSLWVTYTGGSFVVVCVHSGPNVQESV